MTEKQLTKETTWFQDLQAKAQENYENLDLPKLEKIKYQEWITYPKCRQNFPTQELKQIPNEAIFKISYDSKGIEMEAPQEILDSGIKIYNLRNDEAFQDSFVKDHFGQVVPSLGDRISAYNIAQLNGGLFLYIPDNFQTDLPLQIQWKSFAEYMATRFIGIIGKHSQVTIVENFEEEDTNGKQWIAVQEWLIEDNAQVNYAGFEHLLESNHAYIRRHAHVKRDATLNWSMSSLNRSSSVSDLKSRLIGTGAQSTMATISVGTQDKVQGVNGNIVNEAPNTFGEIIQHGVVFDAATITFNGIGHILKAAKNAESQQESRLLMFSKEGRGDVNPILLIDEYEVQAGHAASMGKVDSEQLYYLMSRGLSQQEAEFLVMKGFLIHAFNDFETELVREKNLELLNKALGVS